MSPGRAVRVVAVLVVFAVAVLPAEAAKPAPKCKVVGNTHPSPSYSPLPQNSQHALDSFVVVVPKLSCHPTPKPTPSLGTGGGAAQGPSGGTGQGVNGGKVPFTGADAIRLVVTGLALLTAGGVLVRAGRRRRRARAA